MRYRAWIFVLVTVLLVPGMASARPLSEAEGIYVGQVTAWVNLTQQNATDVHGLYETPRPTRETWWTVLIVAFGGFQSVYTAAHDLDQAPANFRSSHRTLVDRLNAIADVADRGLAAAETRNISALDGVVADLDLALDELDDVTGALDQDIDSINNASDANDAESDATSGGSSSADTVTVRGSGPTVSDSFRLDEGRYRVTARVRVDDFDGFAVWIYGPADSRDLLFNELIDESGTWTGSQMFETDRGGSFMIETENTQSSWTLSFEPI